MTLKVYVAGPLFGSGAVSHNVHRVLRVAEEIRARTNLIPFVPHLFLYWDIVHPHAPQYWLEMDRAWLESCDVMLRLPGTSPGSEMEEQWCDELGIPVIHDLESLIDWAAGREGQPL